MKWSPPQPIQTPRIIIFLHSRQANMNVRSNLKDESVSHQAIEEWKDCMGSILDAITSEDQTPWTGAQREQLVHLVHLVAQARKLLVPSSHE